MYAKQTNTRRKRNSLAIAVKIGIEAILIFLAFREGGLEVGLLTVAAAGIPTIRTGAMEKTEVWVGHDC